MKCIEFASLILTLVFVISCSGSPTHESQIAIVTSPWTATLTATLEATITLTQIPKATSMPEPTNTAIATPTPTQTQTHIFTPTRRPTQTATLTQTPLPPLPSLYVDGAYVKRSDTKKVVWLKGVNVPQLWASKPFSFNSLLYSVGLNKLVAEKWGINVLRVAVDPETAKSRLAEFERLINFAEVNGIYCILTPFPSIYNPSRDGDILSVPDDLVVETMGLLAEKFKGKTNVLYGLWNEPHPGDLGGEYETSWKSWMESGVKVADAIRSKNPTAILVVPGGRLWARDLSYYQNHPFPFENIIYEVHDYWQHPYWQKPNSPSYYDRAMWTWMIDKYPLLVGEFGGACCPNSDPPLQSDHDINYMQEVLQIVDTNPDLVHYTIWELETVNDMGIFQKNLELTRRGQLFRENLTKSPPTRFR